MYGFLKLLLSKAYWRALVHPETWRQTNVALRRAHKDARARKRLWNTLVMLMAPFLVIAYFGIVLGRATGLIGALVGFAVFTGVALYRNRKPVEKDGPVTLKLTDYKKTEPTPPPPATPEFRKELAEMALVCAVLADRAASENFLKTKVLPEGFEVVTRQRHMEILREYGLYERLGSEELDLMLLPDGHWQPGVVDHIAMQLEPLRLLRWILRVDKFLPTVGATMTADFRLAGTLVKQPQLLFEGKDIVSIEDIRTGILAGDQYFFRCWAEGLRRGFFTGDGSDDADRARAYAERMHGKEGEDILLGTTIVSKAEDSDVRLGATLALRRCRVLGWVKSRLYGEAEPLEKLTQIG